jgi:hypothetical protein
MSIAHLLSAAARREIADIKRLAADRVAKYHEALRPVPRTLWPGDMPASVIGVWRSRDFLVQIHQEAAGIVRLSICRTELDDTLEWSQGVSWDDLQAIKNAVGYTQRDAVEVFPAERDVVNFANMRHLWVLAEPLPFVWRAGALRR